MRLRSALGPLALVLLLGCGASTAKPADAADGEKLDAPPTADDTEGGAAKKTDAPAAPTMGSVKREGSATDVPDDYSLTENDCQALGRSYGDAARGDQRAALNPKLTDKQREQANASIDPVVAKLETGWIDVCSKSLAGKNVDHAKIKCALAAKTVKGFDTCLNGDAKK
ncbi:MAG: hypothetical protein ABJE95_27295 [Byssovorax sp.]